MYLSNLRLVDPKLLASRVNLQPSTDVWTVVVHDRTCNDLIFLSLAVSAGQRGILCNTSTRKDHPMVRQGGPESVYSVLEIGSSGTDLELCHDGDFTSTTDSPS